MSVLEKLKEKRSEINKLQEEYNVAAEACHDTEKKRREASQKLKAAKKDHSDIIIEGAKPCCKCSTTVVITKENGTEETSTNVIMPIGHIKCESYKDVKKDLEFPDLFEVGCPFCDLRAFSYKGPEEAVEKWNKIVTK